MWFMNTYYFSSNKYLIVITFTNTVAANRVLFKMQLGWKFHLEFYPALSKFFLKIPQLNLHQCIPWWTVLPLKGRQLIFGLPNLIEFWWSRFAVIVREQELDYVPPCSNQTWTIQNRLRLSSPSLYNSWPWLWQLPSCHSWFAQTGHKQLLWIP